jgi:hypothetical protein
LKPEAWRNGSARESRVSLVVGSTPTVSTKKRRIKMAFKMCSRNCKTKECCKGNSRVTLEEISILNRTNEVGIIFYPVEEGLFAIKPVKGKCPLLGPKGCTSKYKPLSCFLWPFMPTKDGRWIMRMKCIHWDTITKDDFAAVKRRYAQYRSYWKHKVQL